MASLLSFAKHALNDINPFDGPAQALRPPAVPIQRAEFQPNLGRPPLNIGQLPVRRPPPTAAPINQPSPLDLVINQVKPIVHNVQEFAQAATGNKQAQQQFIKDVAPPKPTLGRDKAGQPIYNPEFVKYVQNIAIGSARPKLPIKMLPNAQENVFKSNPMTPKPPKTTGSDKFPTAPITTQDKIIANSTGETPNKVASKRLEARRNADAERAALSHLQGGGTRDEAIKLYKDATGASQKQSAYRVQQVAKEAKQALNTSKRIPNPLSGKFNLPTAKPKQYPIAVQNRSTVVNNITQAENKAYKIEKQLSNSDRTNIADYHEGTKDVTQADNPQLVKQAIKANTELTDTVHGVGEPYGSTPHIEKYFPRYLKDVGGDNPKAQMAMEEAVLAGKPIPLEDQGNYAGFHNKNRIFKNRQEAQQAGFELLHDNPYQDLRRYAAGAKINIGDQAFIRGARQADENLNPQTVGESQRQYPLRLRGGDTVSVGKKGYQALKNYQAPEPIGPIKKTLRGINTTVVKTIVANPIFHGGNQEFNAVFQAAWRLPGNKVANMAKVLRNQVKVSANDVQDFYREGNFSPDYGKNRYGFIAKGLQKAGIDPSKAEISPRAMASIEQNIRVSLWKLGKEKNLPPAEITKVINKTLGGQDIVGDFSSSYGLFLHYLKTNIKLLGDTGVQASKGNVAPLTGLALGAVGYMAAQKAWEKATHNSNALVRAPGVLGVGIQLGKAPGQLKSGKIPGVITNHINPGLTTTVEQVSNRDLKRAVAGPKAKYNSLEGKYGSGRLKTAARNLVGPAHTVQDVNDNRASLPAAGLGYLTGLYNSKLPPPTAPKLNKTQTNATNTDRQAAWDNFTKKARKNISQNNPDLFVKRETARIQEERNAGKATQAFKDSRNLQKVQITRNYDKNLVGAYGLNATDFKAYVAQASSAEVSQLHDLDNKLVSAGLVAKSKFPKSTTKNSKVARSRKGKTAKTAFSSTGFKTASSSKISPPKGVSVRKLAAPNFKSGGVKKLSVSKIPTSYKGKSLV